MCLLWKMEEKRTITHSHTYLFEFICFVRKHACLTVGLGNSLQLVFLLDGVGVRWTLEENIHISLDCICGQFQFTVQTLELPTLAALISSSARHSAIVLMFLKAASLAPVHSSQMAYGRRQRKVRHCRHSHWEGHTELWSDVSESVIDWATGGYSQWINKELPLRVL